MKVCQYDNSVSIGLSYFNTSVVVRASIVFETFRIAFRVNGNVHPHLSGIRHDGIELDTRHWQLVQIRECERTCKACFVRWLIFSNIEYCNFFPLLYTVTILHRHEKLQI